VQNLTLALMNSSARSTYEKLSLVQSAHGDAAYLHAPASISGLTKFGSILHAESTLSCD